MGVRYILFRLFYIIKTKCGYQKKIFPINPKSKTFTSLKNWKKNLPPFFFNGKNIVGLKKNPSKIIKNNYNDIINGTYIFFNKKKINLGKKYDWVTNPINNFKYDIRKHWSEINELSKTSGDIKYVWEKARFVYLYDIIRYDYHFEKDQSEFVFNQIENFIDLNPINQGPNYICSQEISLRILNWTFALYYYKDSQKLNDKLFCKIINSIYWQIHHVYNNINFSRVSVRNNHAITETLLLYLSFKLYPFFPNVKRWSKKGKFWFEKEIEYQIYPDGTFLQFSMNYHRVVIQLLTWGIQLSKLNNDNFKKIVYERAQKSLKFLDTCLDTLNGELPNYGSNDGALFFKFTDDDFRNYRSQLDDLRAVLEGYTYYSSISPYWYGAKFKNKKPIEIPEINKFMNSGYFILQDGNTKTFIRCGSYKDRPYQSDNLHLDIWVNGENILRDNGTYKYNTDNNYIKYFNGTSAHNTVSINKKDQMKKGKRFIWYYWIKDAKGKLYKSKNKFVFFGKIKAYKHVDKNIYHHRKVTKFFGKDEWLINDKIEGFNKMTLYQYWHFSHKIKDKIIITCKDSNNNFVSPLLEEKWYSSYYGIKEPSLRMTFKSETNKLNTKIIYNK